MTGIERFAPLARQLREQHGAPGTRIITVSGMTGVGTTTIAKLLCDRYDLDRVNAGDFFRSLAAEFDMTIQEFEEQAAQLEAEHDRDFDLEWDRQALEYAFTRDDFLLEGRLAGALLDGIAPVRVYVDCDQDTVVERLTDREDMTRDAAREHVEVRNAEVLERYTAKYGVDPRDERFYNVIVDNSQPLDTVREQVVQQVEQTLPDDW